MNSVTILLCALAISRSTSFVVDHSSRTSFRPKSALNIVAQKMSAMDAVLEFNTNFKAGLKFVLVPQVELKERARAAREAQAAMQNDATGDVVTPDFVPTDTLNFVDVQAVIEQPRDLTIQSLNFDSFPKVDSINDMISKASEAASSISLPEMDSINNIMAKASGAASSFSVPEIDVYSKASQFASSISIPEFDIASKASQITSGMSAPDINVLREALSKSFPDRSFMEIQDLTYQLAGIASTVQERVRQFETPDIIKEFSREIPDVSSLIGERYQVALDNLMSPNSVPSEVLADLKARVASIEIQEFVQVRGPEVPELHFVPIVPAEKFDAVFDNLNQLIHTDGWTLPDLMQTINFQELGGWYSGAIVGAFLTASLLAKSKTPPMERQPKPATIKKQARKPFAGKVASNPVVSKSWPRGAVTGGTATAVVSEERVRWESLVSDLTVAVTTLSKELQEIKADKAKNDYLLASMKTDVRMLKDAVDASDRSERQLRQEVEMTTRRANDLQTKLMAAQMKVEALELEKLSLTNGFKELSGETEFVLMKPAPPKTPPPKLVMARPTENVWFANFVSATS